MSTSPISQRTHTKYARDACGRPWCHTCNLHHDGECDTDMVARQAQGAGWCHKHSRYHPKYIKAAREVQEWIKEHYAPKE